MPFLDELCSKLGAIWDRTHIVSFSKASADGIVPRWTRDLRPLPETGMTAGHLLELHSVLDERHELADDTPLRIDVLEEDWLFSGGLDDFVISLLGTHSTPPESGFPTRQLETSVRDVEPGQTLGGVVEDFKRLVVGLDGDLGEQLLVVKELPDAAAGTGTRRTHVIAWHRVEHDDIGSVSELYFVLHVGAELEAASDTLEVGEAPPGVAVRMRGSVTDAQPFAGVERLEDIPVTLGGRAAVSGGDVGTYVLDARLPAGDHPLRFSRAGIDARELTVRVAVAAGTGVVTVTVRDGANVLASAATPGAASGASVLTLDLPELALRVHKLRGTVLWPDSRPDDVDAAYHGTPLAERRVYALPLPDDGALADLRPKTTREWEALKRRPGVLASTRVGRPGPKERTAADGRFEIKYVDFSAGKRYLLWVERFAPRTAADTRSELPDHVVRTLRRELIRLNRATLAQTGEAGIVLPRNRNLVDHEYNLTREPVQWGVDALRVVDRPARTLVRPRRETREQFDTANPLAAGIGEELAVPADRIVDGLELQVLPLAVLDEAADARGRSAERARAALATAAAAAFPDGYDAGDVKLALDVERIVDWLDWSAGPPWEAGAVDARVVELLERTFVVRDQLRSGARLGVGDARWHIDAVSLADAAFVAVPEGAALVANRSLNAAIGAAAAVRPTHVPVLKALAPFLPGLAPRRVYLAPGHGLFPANGQLASAAAADWESTRGGYMLNAGEDEVDALLAAEAGRLIRRNGAIVYAPRELWDFTAAGVSNTVAGHFPAVATPEFPRLWQQNPVYYLGARDAAAHGNGVVTAHPDRRFPIAAGKNGQGIDARIAHVRVLAGGAAPPHIMLAPHTNASGVNARGCVIEYLNVGPQPPRAAGDANPLGLAFSQRTLARVRERTHIPEYGGGVRTMDRLNSESIADLTQTFDHFQFEQAGVESVCEERVAGPTTGAAPAVPLVPAHAPRVVNCYERIHGPGTWPPAGIAAGGVMTPRPFLNAAGQPHSMPVALSELAFHDQPDDARLLSRAWFRRLAAEGMAIAIDEALRADPAAVDDRAVKAVLRRVVGDTPPVVALNPTGAVATPAMIRAALVVAVDAAAPAPATATLGALVTAALGRARTLTRQGLVDRMQTELREIAGWEAADADALVRAWVSGPDPDRPTEAPTRAEAGALVCAALGLTPASLQTAETRGVGHPAAPLLRRAAAPESPSALLGPLEAGELAARLHALGPQDVHRVADAWLADAAWARLGAELEQGTPVVVVVRTDGAAWKTPDQATNNGRGDVEIHVSAGGERRTLECGARGPGLAVSATWFLDLPSTNGPVDLEIELWVEHRTAGRLRVGVKSGRLRVLPRQSP